MCSKYWRHRKPIWYVLPLVFVGGIFFSQFQYPIPSFNIEMEWSCLFFIVLTILGLLFWGSGNSLLDTFIDLLSDWGLIWQLSPISFSFSLILQIYCQIKLTKIWFEIYPYWWIPFQHGFHDAFWFRVFLCFDSCSPFPAAYA